MIVTFETGEFPIRCPRRTRKQPMNVRFTRVVSIVSVIVLALVWAGHMPAGHAAAHAQVSASAGKPAASFNGRYFQSFFITGHSLRQLAPDGIDLSLMAAGQYLSQTILGLVGDSNGLVEKAAGIGHITLPQEG